MFFYVKVVFNTAYNTYNNRDQNWNENTLPESKVYSVLNKSLKFYSFNFTKKMSNNFLIPLSTAIAINTSGSNYCHPKFSSLGLWSDK